MFTRRLGFFLKYDFPALLFIACLLGFVFGINSNNLGFYADDAYFLNVIKLDSSFKDLFQCFKSYVTGRNLHILWHYLITLLSGGSIAKMHFISVLLEVVTAGLFYFILRILNVNVYASFVSIVLFVLYPNHGETHYWISSIPMNILSTLLVLLFILFTLLVINKIEKESPFTAADFIKYITLFLIFLCAMFTYDQAVPVVMLIATFSAGYVSFQKPIFRRIILLLWLLTLIIFFTLLTLKIINPAGGPTFSHLTFQWVSYNFLLSLKIWLKMAVVHYKSFGPLSLSEKMTVFFVTIIFAIVSLLLQIESVKKKKQSLQNHICDKKKNINDRSLGLFLIVSGIAIFLAASFPSYIWSISPRHLYLPSVGVTFFVSGLLTYLPAHTMNKRKNAVFLTCYMSLLIAGYMAANIKEKNGWINSYKLRATFYQSLLKEEGEVKNQNLLLVKFPSNPILGSPQLAFLTGEQSPALSIITEGGISVNSISLHPVPSKNGYFLHTEPYRWGALALSYIDRSEALPVLFEKIEDSKIFYKVDRLGNFFKPDNFYQVHKNYFSEANTKSLEAIKIEDNYILSLPNIKLNDGEILAIIPSILGSTSHLEPATYSNSNDLEPYIIPIAVPENFTGLSQTFDFKFNVVLSRIDGFQLYLVNQKGSKLLDSVILNNAE